MEPANGTRRTRSMIWGLFLIGIGSAFLLERLGLLTFDAAGDLWPTVLLVIALIRVIEGRIGSALFFALLGAWFLAVNFYWMGLTYENSWPLIVVAVGASIVIKALTGEGRPDLRQKEKSDE